jgi:hypothetical protein
MLLSAAGLTPKTNEGPTVISNLEILDRNCITKILQLPLLSLWKCTMYREVHAMFGPNEALCKTAT